MIYILCAFEAEARALIDKYKLTKYKSGVYTLFKNKEVVIFICGMGQENAQLAMQDLMLHFPNQDNDILINLGICAAQNSFEVGSLLQVSKLQSQEESHLLTTVNSGIPTASCFSSSKVLDRPVNEDIAEMEALGIYTNIFPHFKPNNISILKVVSDNFKPTKFNKGFIISLINKNLPQITRHINIMKESTQ